MITILPVGNPGAKVHFLREEISMPRYINLFTLGAILALVASDCSSRTSPGQDATVRPITDILASGPEFTGIGPISATLLVKTTLPVACSVVYGTTPAYGQIATDSDMAGGAHSDHHPLLTGLTPDTLYHARLQGVGPDGTLYRSLEYTFRTAPAPAASGQPNLALLEAGARLVGVSSNFGDGPDDGPWGGLNALDGDGATAWSSDGDGDEAWIEIELAAPAHVTQISFWSRTMGSTAEIHSFQIVTDRGETFGPFELADAGQSYIFATDFTAGRLRFEALTSSGGNTGAVEIEVYGEPEG
jgi:hypothetical protein